MKKPHVIVAVHGLHTGSESWTDSLRRYAEDKPEYRDLIDVEEYDFGKLLAIQMYMSGIFSPLGWSYQNRFVNWFNKMMDDFYKRGREYSFVCHSWGTWLTHGMLWRNKKIKPKVVALFGSVLSEHFKATKFPQMFKRGQVGKLINIWSPNDSIIEKTLVRIPPFGRLGSRGFIDGLKKENVVQIETKEFHGGYFLKENREQYFDMLLQQCLE